MTRAKEEFETWPAILDHALELVDTAIPEFHNLYEARFGTFAPGSGRKGHYVSLGVNYNLGNTSDAENRFPQARRKRRLMVIEAWERKAHPPKESEEDTE